MRKLGIFCLRQKIGLILAYGWLQRDSRWDPGVTLLPCGELRSRVSLHPFCSGTLELRRDYILLTLEEISVRPFE